MKAILTATDMVRLLDLKPHPEGGHFRETFRDTRSSVAQEGDGGRAASTAIYYLLARGERSHWHRTDAAEVWNWYAGAPLRLDIAPETEARERVTLGSDLAAGERPQCGRARSRLAGGGNARRMDARRLHGRARLRLRAVRAGAEGLGARIKAEHQTMYWPPFAVSVEPVMKLASSAARKRTQRATSSGSPRRPSGTSGRMLFSSTSFGTALTMSVAM